MASSPAAPAVDPRPSNDSTSDDPLAGVPPLTTRLATTREDRIDALKLIADAVAQQRQAGARAIIFHPLTVCGFVAVLGAIGQLLYKGSRSDLALIGTTFAGTVMAGLVSVRWMVSGYIEEAERVGTWRWLDQGRDRADTVHVEGAVDNGSDGDDILLTRFGDTAIGALVLRGVRQTASAEDAADGVASQSQSSPRSDVTGTIRAWTVSRRYRGRGVGLALLEDAVRLCKSRHWGGPTFAHDHAHSARLLPKLAFGGGGGSGGSGGFTLLDFNAGLIDRRDRRARGKLAAVLQADGFRALPENDFARSLGRRVAGGPGESKTASRTASVTARRKGEDGAKRK